MRKKRKKTTIKSHFTKKKESLMYCILAALLVKGFKKYAKQYK